MSLDLDMNPAPTPDGVEESEVDHEVVRCFTECNLALNPTLQTMLNEHFSHRTERRGAGYTQSTRYLATFVNEARRGDEYGELRLFVERGADQVRTLLEAQERLGLPCSWRSLDLKPIPPELSSDEELLKLYTEQRLRQSLLRSLPDLVKLEESKLIASMISNLIMPVEDEALQAIYSCPDEIKIGTCPLAEKYFLEVADSFIRRSGRVNIITDGEKTPLLIEKVGLGDDHSCISLAPLLLNGVCLPAGSLLGTRYEGSVSQRPNRKIPGDVIPLSRCEGFRFLRLTTLAVSPENRQRAFTTHFKAQTDAGLFAPHTATVQGLKALAMNEL